MSGLFAQERRAENRERAAMIKRRVGVGDAIMALNLDTDLGNSCPCCHGLGVLKASASGESATCESCDETFDAIALVRAAKGFSFNGACAFLERECLKAKDDRTGRLF